MRIAARSCVLIVSALTAGGFALSDRVGAAEPTSFGLTEGPDNATVRVGDRSVLEYRTQASPRKPYVRQLFSPGGVQVLRDAVPDHKHHHGLMFALGVDGVDFWGEAAGAGTEKPRAPLHTMTREFLGASCPRFSQMLDWTDARGKQLVVERRELGVAAPKGPTAVTLVLWESELRPAAGVAAVKFDGHHYYGLGMRFVKSMDEGGRFFNASNRPGDIVRGSERLVAARWCAYTAKAEGKPVTVAIFDHPMNPRYPNKMFTMTPPFAYLSATLNLWKEPLELRAGVKLRLRYAVAVWDGETSAARIESLYKLWSTAR